ncbi:hypothetical protein EV142_108143 [Flavobacterium circumlabens]|uniref:Uncharacterized protein n=1 Tax=Flavobacterium circumlabens TaxID=2133765 RepID=A0ABY2AUY1_9FLAO|nr:hypothetical protein EV142_108143 [Flavobacterium circumlabens]
MILAPGFSFLTLYNSLNLNQKKTHTKSYREGGTTNHDF